MVPQNEHGNNRMTAISETMQQQVELRRRELERRIVTAQHDLNEGKVQLGQDGMPEHSTTQRTTALSIRTMPATTAARTKTKLLHRHAQAIAEALWLYQYGHNEHYDGTNDSGNGANNHHAVPSNDDDSRLLVSRAQSILHEWRLSLTEGDTVHCPDYMDEYEFNDERRGFVKLYAATIQRVALCGASVSLGDSSMPSGIPYQLTDEERAIYVNFNNYPDDSRWIVLRPNDPLARNVVPLGAHERTRRAIQPSYPDYCQQSTNDDVPTTTMLLVDSDLHCNGSPSHTTKQEQVPSSLAGIPPSAVDKTESVTVAPLKNGTKRKRTLNSKKKTSAKKPKSARRPKAVDGRTAKNHVVGTSGGIGTTDTPSVSKSPPSKKRVDAPLVSKPPPSSRKRVIDRKRKRPPRQRAVEERNPVTETSVGKEEAVTSISSVPVVAANDQTAGPDGEIQESTVVASQRNCDNMDVSETGVTKEAVTSNSHSPVIANDQTSGPDCETSKSAIIASQSNCDNMNSKETDGQLATGEGEKSPSPVSTVVPASKDEKKRTSRPNKLDFTWICTQCNEAECATDPEAGLVLCEGGCHRPFHFPCANLSAPPSSDEDWVCEDCLNGRHRCSLCEEYGIVGREVFCCDNKDCGLFFHESCLSMQNVEMEVTDSAAEGEDFDDEIAFHRKVRFVCPAHTCWTCTEDYVPPDDDDSEDVAANEKKGKGRKKRNKGSSCFAQKRDSNQFRCLHCPIAYHLTCIPPVARFHELALLCHNHAGTRKLPDLDLESSMQAEVEAEYERKCEKVKRKEVIEKNAQGQETNQFFPSVRGDVFVTDEDRLLMHLQEEAPDHEYLINGLSFCLPYDIKNEVHSKPPSYQHVYSNQYDRTNRPKRKPPSDGKCQCRAKGLSICDESCLNRMMMIECVGDANKAKGENNPYWNCDLGPSCSNRSLGLKQFAKCKPMREQGKGWGLVAVNGIKARELVQEYVGEIIDEKEKEARLQKWTRDHPNDPNFYVMALDSGWYIDARLKANLSRFINHSCAPNCKLVPFNVNGYMRVGIYSLVDIAPGEFLSYDYQFDTKHGDKFRCRCGAANCRGTMKGGKGEDGTIEQKTRKEEWQDAKAAYDRDVKFLEDVAQNEKERTSQVDYLVPGAENATETVAAGPNEKKYRTTAMDSRLFLWRNVVKGDVSDRPRSLRRKTKKTIPTDKLPTVDVLSAIMKSKTGKTE